MIEIVFGDSACGSLKMAQHYGEGEYQNGCIGVSVSHGDGSAPTKEELDVALREAEERLRLAWEEGKPLGGNPADVYGFSLALGVGDISENTPGVKRMRAMEHLLSIYPHGEGQQAARELLEPVKQTMSLIHKRVAAGEPLRAWTGNCPDEACGFCWFMGQLSQWNADDGQVSFVKLPEWEEDEKGAVTQKNGLGELAPGNWHRYLALQKPASSALMQSCAALWGKLQEENAPLRAMLNGRLVSAPETLYDSFIMREIAEAEDEFSEAVIIGRVLGKYCLGIGDAWVAHRIEAMIRAGALKAVSEAPADSPIYHRILRKCV